MGNTYPVKHVKCYNCFTIFKVCVNKSNDVLVNKVKAVECACGKILCIPNEWKISISKDYQKTLDIVSDKISHRLSIMKFDSLSKCWICNTSIITFNTGYNSLYNSCMKCETVITRKMSSVSIKYNKIKITNRYTDDNLGVIINPKWYLDLSEYKYLKNEDKLLKKNNKLRKKKNG